MYIKRANSVLEARVHRVAKQNEPHRKKTRKDYRSKGADREAESWN
jgi:hypothetical protein